MKERTRMARRLLLNGDPALVGGLFQILMLPEKACRVSDIANQSDKDVLFPI
jgi:hypothetical protein